MTPMELDEWLKVIRANNCISFAGEFYHSQQPYQFKINVVLGPDNTPDVTSEITPPQPGGWKAPKNLDDYERLFATDQEHKINE